MMRLLSFVAALKIEHTDLGGLNLYDAFICGHGFENFPADLTIFCAFVIDHIAAETKAEIEMNLLDADQKVLDPHMALVNLETVGFEPLTIQWVLRFPAPGRYSLQVKLRGSSSVVQYPFFVGKANDEMPKL